MNTRRSAQANSAPPAADRALTETPHLIARQVPGSLNTSLEILDVARLDQEIGHLSAQNECLLKSVDMLVQLHESEKAQRHSLQTTLDRLLGEIGTPTSARPLEAVASELRNGVSEDLKPILHAIIELLELSARRGYPHSAVISDPNEIAAVADSRDGLAKEGNTAHQHLSDESPGALPDILTKSVEELVGKRRENYRKTLATNKPKVCQNDRRTAFEGHRPRVWIPVTSGTPKH